jgi:hypothetical protein
MPPEESGTQIARTQKKPEHNSDATLLESGVNSCVEMVCFIVDFHAHCEYFSDYDSR